jgi:16S rRNA (adenine1518-N6/adenine1519-N6)-dimethyltransferase
VTLSRAHAVAQLDSAGLRPKRSLGQNFVVDANTVRRIARLARIGAGDHVVEIGAGLGSLTLALAETGAHVLAIEVDESLVALLRDNVSECPNVTVVHADAMTIDWPALLQTHSDEKTNWHLIANLPYNVGTPLVADILDTVPAITHMLVMVQKEVGERLAAIPSTSAYGAISVKVAFWGVATVEGVVPPTVFLPRPNVDSALVSITRHSTPLANDIQPKKMFHLVQAGFGKRRKMLRSSLKGIVTPEQFEKAGISPTARAEELDVQDWIRLTREVHGS